VATHTFDDFLDILRSSVAAAQARVAARNAAREVSRAAGGGGPPGTLRKLLDGRSPPAAPAAALEVPLRDLALGGVSPRLSRFVFEVDVAVERTAAARGRQEVALLLDPEPRPWGRAHRLRVELDGPQPGAGSVYLDGHEIRTLGAALGPGGPDHPGDTRHG
jgi:hypothetical protein